MRDLYTWLMHAIRMLQAVSGSRSPIGTSLRCLPLKNFKNSLLASAAAKVCSIFSCLMISLHTYEQPSQRKVPSAENRSLSSTKCTMLCRVTWQNFISCVSSTNTLCRRIKFLAKSSISCVHPSLPEPNTSSVILTARIQILYCSSRSTPPKTYLDAGKANFCSSSAFQKPKWWEILWDFCHISTLYQ